MTRREAIINGARIFVLRWRVLRGRALPAVGSALLVWLDRWAVRLHQSDER